MKRLLLILLCLPMIGFGQQTYVPDDNFEQALINFGIEEHSTNKKLLRITDLLGRETKQTNQPLFYIYNDGTVEKKIVIE